MRIIRSINNMQRVSMDLKQKGKSIGFVPTMGALHAGHLSLIKRACKENDFTIVSLFLNPTQFGPNEDFRRYPRNLNTDVSLCKKEGVDIIFYPEIFIERLSDVLCGKFRPGHFQGVATIVTKLFNIVQPDIAYFGQKDAQQAIIIQRMTRDLNIPVKINVMPIIRESHGLALSSRNNYLTVKQREEAVVLSQALRNAKTMIKQGVIDSAKIILVMRKIIQKRKSARIQYIQIVDLDELLPVKKVKHKVLVALAVWFGRTRLIDNIIVRP